MEKFFALPEEKQNAIIDAGLSAFGKTGYKKTSVNDIAVAAGISKGMVFHYFKTKKQMYFYLIKIAGNELASAFPHSSIQGLPDFFDRIRYATKIKVSVLNKRPALFDFLTCVYLETDAEVAAEIQQQMAAGEGIRNEFVLLDFDRKKFKAGVKPELVYNILLKYAQGYVNSASLSGGYGADKILAEFDECLSLMKNNFYREEYL